MKKETKKKILLQFEKHLAFLYRILKGNKVRMDHNNYVNMQYVFAAGCVFSIKGGKIKSL